MLLIVLMIKSIFTVVQEYYQSNFNLTSDNGVPLGITTYNNKFYIIDNV